jgi:hypothetical protein
VEKRRSALPEPAHAQRHARQVAGRVAQAASEVKDTAQQAIKKVRNARSDLGDATQQTAQTMKQYAQCPRGQIPPPSISLEKAKEEPSFLRRR